MSEKNAIPRLQYFDIAKGIGIICIILGHLSIATINSIVFTFHVPLFFLISGYFIKPTSDTRLFIKTKAHQLLIPYVITALFLTIGVAVKRAINTQTTVNFFSDIIQMILASLYGSGTIEYYTPVYLGQIGAIWFLLALFFSTIIVKYFLNDTYGIAAIIIIAYVGYKTTDMLWLPLSLQAGMTASIFVWIGYLARKNNWITPKPKLPVLFFSTLTILYCFTYAGRFYMVRNYYEHGFLDLIGGCAATYLILQISKLITSHTHLLSAVLTFWGRNSLYILCFHAFELRVINWTWLKALALDTLHLPFAVYIFLLLCLKLAFYTIGIFVCKAIKNVFSISKNNI